MKTVWIILALCLVFTTAACDQWWRLTGAEEAAVAAKVAVDVRQRASATRFAPVIIRLDIQANLAAMSRADRAATIARVSRSVLSDVSTKQVQVVHSYSIVPILSAWANEKGLAELAMNPRVKEIVLDRLDYELLDESTKTIEANLAWPTSTGTGALVAILDTGTDRRHPFLGQRVPYEACFRKDGKCKHMKSEYIGEGAARSSRSHGMHVAGIAAGANGSPGGGPQNGVAPGAGIIGINVFSAEGSYIGDQIKALEWVAKLREVDHVRVFAANLSLGDGLEHQVDCDLAEKDLKTIIDWLRALGVATVVAAGNNGSDKAVSAPGCISSAVTVSSVTNQDAIHTGHNRSSLTDLMAPGEDILSSIPDIPYDGMGDYGEDSGTSMAAPHVSGAIALLSAGAPHRTLEEILTVLSQTGEPLTEATGQTYRRINVNKALAQLRAP